mgnify:FL=1
MNKGTSHGLEQDSKVHGHVKGVGNWKDNGIHTKVELNVEDEEWY